MKESEIISILKQNANHYLDGLGIGDDASMISISNDSYLVTTVDSMEDGTHFIIDKISAEELAQKLIEVNISDLAAMGGAQPMYAHFSLGKPVDINEEYLRKFLISFSGYLKNKNITLLGGDTYRSSKLNLSLSLQGIIKKNSVKKVSTAKAGDKIAVSRNIGDSKAGLFCLQNSMPPYTELEELLIDEHHNTMSELEKSQYLSSLKDVTAMTDLSDGLYIGLKKMFLDQEFGVEIDLKKLPISENLERFCTLNDFDRYKYSLEGGEDYALLFSYKESIEDEILKNGFYPIGEVTNSGEEVFIIDGQRKEFNLKTFEH